MQADAPVYIPEIYQFCDSHINEGEPLRRFRISIIIEEIDENGIPGKGKQPLEFKECKNDLNYQERCANCEQRYEEIFIEREKRLEEFSE